MTVLVSALVAAVVTLGIEYFAKPSLEARKDRIVERARRRRTIEANLRALGFRYGQLEAMLKEPGPRLELATDEVHAAIRSHTDALVKAIADGGGELTDEETRGLSDLTAAWATYLHLHDDDEPVNGRVRFLERIEPVDEALHNAFFERGPFARRRALRRLREIATSREDD
jgi:hypothetical protein